MNHTCKSSKYSYSYILYIRAESSVKDRNRIFGSKLLTISGYYPIISKNFLISYVKLKLYHRCIFQQIFVFYALQLIFPRSVPINKYQLCYNQLHSGNKSEKEVYIIKTSTRNKKKSFSPTFVHWSFNVGLWTHAWTCSIILDKIGKELKSSSEEKIINKNDSKNKNESWMPTNTIALCDTKQAS